MPVSQMRNGLTAENSIFSQKPDIKVGRSRFDLGRMNFFTSDLGMIIPVDLFETLPGDEFNLGCQYKIDFRPLIVPTFTSYKVKIHYYYCPNEFLWSGWETFITKGRSGNLALTVPQVRADLLSVDSGSAFQKLSGLTDPNFKTTDGTYYPYAPMSLLDFFCGNIPYDYSVGSDDVNTHYLPYINGSISYADLAKTGFKSSPASALPFVMYQKIFRSNYLDPNLYANGTVKNDIWFPEDIDSSHWRINYAGTNIGLDANAFFVPQDASLPDEGDLIANFVPIAQPVATPETVVGDNAVNLTQLRYSMYTDDMFTTALPFLQRGSQQSLNIFNSFDSYVKFLDEDIPVSDSSGSVPVDGFSLFDQSVPVVGFGSSPDLVGRLFGSFASGNLTPLGIPAKSVNFSLTAQALRNLLALSVWQERNALTNGSYGQFIKVHYDRYPDNQYCEPIYIGGTTSVFNVNSVLQTSQSTDTSKQGNPVGVGGSSRQQSIGRFRAPDYGFIMALMTVIPDTIYSQLNEHWKTDKNPDDFYMPEYEKLSYQPILNKQLFFSNEESEDDDVFGYSNRYVYLKQREAVAHGRFALPASVDTYYHSYVQSRQFADTPQLSQQFVTVYPPNIDRSFLAYPGEPCFLVQFYSDVKATRPLSYVSQPNTFGF